MYDFWNIKKYSFFIYRIDIFGPTGDRSGHTVFESFNLKQSFVICMFNSEMKHLEKNLLRPWSPSKFAVSNDPDCSPLKQILINLYIHIHYIHRCFSMYHLQKSKPHREPTVQNPPQTDVLWHRHHATICCESCSGPCAEKWATEPAPRSCPRCRRAAGRKQSRPLKLRIIHRYVY